MHNRNRTLAFFCLLGALLTAGIAQAAEPMDFPLYPLDGEQQQLSDYRGRWVVLNYWATWCPPCRKELPELDLFHEKHHETNAVVLGINTEDISDDELKLFIDRQFLSFPMFRQDAAAPTPFGPLDGLPTTFLISPDGEAVAVQTGGVTADLLEHFIDNYQPDPAPETIADGKDSEPADSDAQPGE